LAGCLKGSDSSEHLKIQKYIKYHWLGMPSQINQNHYAITKCKGWHISPKQKKEFLSKARTDPLPNDVKAKLNHVTVQKFGTF
jgi:hypothetical protein